MKVTKSESLQVNYNGYKIEVSKPSKTYAYWVRGINLEASEGGFNSPKSALLAAKHLIDSEVLGNE